MKKIKHILLGFAILSPISAWSSWSNAYEVFDDGGRVYLSLKLGGVNVNASKMKNEIGDATATYYIVDFSGYQLVSDYIKNTLSDSTLASDSFYVNIGKSKPSEKLNSFSFYSSVGVGFVMPNYQNWRGEVSWDHITEYSYDATPIFVQDYNFTTSSGTLSGGGVGTYEVATGSMSSDVQTDIYMFNAYYDFYEGRKKPVGEWIPYLGFGLGYANITTTMQLNDEYGDLSGIESINQYGTESVTGTGFYTFSAVDYTQNSLALAGMLGVSYGFSNMMFFDLGLKLTWIDKITWGLSKTNLGSKDILSAESPLMTSFTAGLRIEF